jgi:hypothetical protein
MLGIAQSKNSAAFTGIIGLLYYDNITASSISAGVTRPLSNLGIKCYLFQTVVLEGICLSRVRHFFHRAVKLAVENTAVAKSRSLRGQACQVAGITEHRNMMKGLATVRERTVVKPTEVMFQAALSPKVHLGLVVNTPRRVREKANWGADLFAEVDIKTVKEDVV